jgi:hypothetical protein
MNGKYIDLETILNMWLEASEWKDRQDIVKVMTPEMKAAWQQQQQMNSVAAKAQAQASLNDQKAQQRQQADDNATDNRIKRDLVRESFRNASMGEAVTGEPSGGLSFGNE